VVIAFLVAGGLSVVATLLAITRLNAVHALLYLIGSLLALSVAFYTLGAAFAAVLEIMVYAGAIVVLLLFVVMILNLGSHSTGAERTLLRPRVWVGPAIMVILIGVELAVLLAGGAPPDVRSSAVGAKAVSLKVFGPYVLAVEAASFLLLAGVVGAFHLGRKFIENGSDSRTTDRVPGHVTGRTEQKEEVS
jgi:NADH-quinone oxidoreductase subunit J